MLPLHQATNDPISVGAAALRARLHTEKKRPTRGWADGMLGATCNLYPATCDLRCRLGATLES
jgi:hypothetical protein